MIGKKNLLVIWVGRQSLEIMGGKIIKPEQLVLPTEIVSSLEVQDRDAVYGVVKEWAKERSVHGMEVVWVFSPDVYFELVLGEDDQNNSEEKIIRFLDLLPFEQVESRVYMSYPTASEKRVVAINSELYSSLKHAFSLQGYLSKAEISLSMLSSKLQKKQALDKEVYDYVTSHISEIEKRRLVEDAEPDVLVGVSKDKTGVKVKKEKTKLPLLIGAFVFLLVVAIVMYMILY